MKSLRNSLKLVLALVLVVALAVTGCGKAETEGTDTTKESGSKTDSSATKTDDKASASSDAVELTWYFIGNGQQDDVDAVEAEINAYIKDKINATVQLQCFDWGSYNDKLTTMIASQEEFDICFTSSWTNNYLQQAAKGAFVPLNDYFENELAGTAALIGDTFLSGSQIDGVNYAIPANKEKAHQWGMLFRVDLLEKYDLSVDGIKSLEDIEPLLAVIKENEPNVYPLQALDGESPFKLMDFDRIGDDKYPGVVWNDSENLKVFNEFEAPETMAFFKQMHEYYKAGYIREDAASINDFSADFNAGKIFASTQSLKPGKDAEMTNSSGYEWVQVEMTPAVISNRDTTGSMQAISATSANPDVAAQFLELFNTDAYLNNLVNFGIEGTHYTKKSDDVIEPIADTGYNPGTGWMFGNQFINYLLPNEDPEKWAKFEAFNSGSVGTQTLGFVFNAESVKSEIAQCNNVWDQYVPALETGTVDPEEFLPKAIQAFKDAGVEKIIAEKQAQLDAWAAANK